MAKPLVAITARVDILPDRNERRDALDRRVAGLIVQLGGTPVPLVNDRDSVEAMLETVDIAALVLSGGNDLAAVGGDAPERDELERHLLAWASNSLRPVVGICRGMQVIAVEAGAALRRSDRHVCARHTLHGRLKGEVPSHHSWCIERVPAGFSALAHADDGTCEAFLSDDGRILGMMWHPERMAPPRTEDLAILRSVLKL